MTIVLISLLAGLGVASAQADAPILTEGGGRQTPRVAEQTPATVPSNTTSIPLPSPSPIQTTTPLSPTTSPGTSSSTTGTPGSAYSIPAKSAEKTDNQASHVVRFDPADGSKPTQSTVKTGTLTTPPQQNPQRPGFRFDGWTHDGQPFDFQTPILQDTTLKATWSKITDWTLSPDHGPASGARLTISPPDRQEPQFSSIHTEGDQIVGLTGDGRIYTWTQDNMPQQVPSPAQAPDGFHYLQAAVGSQRQVVLGSDQQIYIWARGQAVPTIINTSQSTKFTSISMNGEHLLAVDRQGQVHVFRASQRDSQNTNPSPDEQETISLPRQALAVLAVASSSRILIVDADGQAWTWDAANTGKAKITRIKQEPGTRTVQAQALNQGFLFLGADGQAWYLPDGTTAMTQVSLPDSEQIGRINSSDEQATVLDKDGHIWGWKPSNKPTRADEGSQQYMQAASTSGKITAIDRQGNMFTWSPDPQSNPDKPARLNTRTTPTLESASMDSQTLTLTKSGDAWQAEIPSHKPGQATILITGKQDNQTFTRSLEYTVDQPLKRDIEQRTALTVHFDTGGGRPEPPDQHFSTLNSKMKRPSPDPAREGYLFDGWFIGQVAYDFSKPVTGNLTLTAKWSPESRNSKWSISPDKGSQLGSESTTITPPDIVRRGIRFSQVSGSKGGYFSLAVGSDGNAYAWGNNKYGQLGDGTTAEYRTTPIKVSKPANTPPDFTYVQVSAGDQHSLALGSDGKAYAWGYNQYGQLGDGTFTKQSTPVLVSKPEGAPTDFTYAQVSAGDHHSMALGSDGNAYTWGYNGYGQLGDGTFTNRSTPVSVSKRKGAPTDFTYAQVSAGYDFSLAVGSDGYAYTWGANGNGQLGNNTSGSNMYSTVPVRVRDPAYPTDASKGLKVTQISGGWQHSLAVGSDGYAYTWGRNYLGQLGNNTGGYNMYSTVPVRVRDPAYPTDASKGLKAVQVSGGSEHSLALGSDGYAYTWGYNWYHQLGNDSSSDSHIPVRVRDPAYPTETSKGLKAVQVSSGFYHSLAVGSDGDTYAWGANGSGQLGDGTTNTKSVPVPVMSNQQLVITGIKFGSDAASGLTCGTGSSVTVLTPAHLPGTVQVSVDYTLGGAPQPPDTTLRYTYLPTNVLPQAGGEGILLALTTGMTGMGGVLAARRHRREQHKLLHTSHE